MVHCVGLERCFFFSLPLAAQSQEIFAFEWTEGEGQLVVQLTWTRLPQGLKNSPTLFNEALSEDLYEYRTCHPEVILLQYVDDLMLAGTTEEACSCATGDLLLTPGTLGYRVSAKKAQAEWEARLHPSNPLKLKLV